MLHNAKYKYCKVSPCKTHHVYEDKPLYETRFFNVLKFHSPGLAPVCDHTGAFHIKMDGTPAYSERYQRVFGFYDERAAVATASGWFHILPDSKPLYAKRYAWCGNFQEGLCTVRDPEGHYFHINKEGKRTYEQSYAYAGDFRDGLAVVQNPQGKQTHINANGNFQHTKWYDALDVFHKGYARAKDAKGWFHIDESGHEIYSARFLNVEPFYNGFAYAETFSGMRIILDESGNQIKELSTATSDPFHQTSAEMVSYWRLETLRTAGKLKLFDLLPATFQSLKKWERLLLGLQEMGFVFQQDNHWKLTEKGSFCTSIHPYSLAPALNLWDEEHHLSWRDLAYSLESDKCAFAKNYHAEWFDYLSKHPEKCQHYHQCLANYAQRDYGKIVETIDLSIHHSIVDIGGSSGTLLRLILNHFSHLNGELLDLPEVCSNAFIPDHLAPRMKIVPCNFFEAWPQLESECAILARVLHDWSDEKALEILKHIPCHTIFVVENILNKRTGSGALLDLNMLVMTGGKERSLEDFQNLLSKAGYQLQEIRPLNEVSSIIVAKR